MHSCTVLHNGHACVHRYDITWPTDPSPFSGLKLNFKLNYVDKCGLRRGPVKKFDLVCGSTYCIYLYLMVFLNLRIHSNAMLYLKSHWLIFDQ